LGEAGKALAVLRAAQEEYPKSFAIAANLGTAWQLQGDWQQAASALQQAVLLAPGKKQAAEQYHLKLVQLRLKEPMNSQGLDDLREAVEKLAKAGGAEEHKGHVGGLPALSKRPLLIKFNDTALAPVSATGVNTLPWVLLADTHLDAKSRPTFPKYLEELNGKK